MIENLVKPLIFGEDPFYREKIWHHLNEMQRRNRATLTDRVMAWSTGAVGPGRSGARRAGPQAAGRLPLQRCRPTPARCAATTCRVAWTRPRRTPTSPSRAKSAATRPSSSTPAAPDPERAEPEGGHRGLRRRARGGRAGHGADARLLPLLHARRGVYIGKELEKLNYPWMEEPMDEHSMSSYIWLTAEPDHCRSAARDGRGQDVHPRRVDPPGCV